MDSPMTDPTPRLSWGHINLNVGSLERSIEFYGKLGFESFIPAIPYLGLTIESEAKTVPDPSAVALGLPPNTRGRGCIMRLGQGFPMLDLTELSIETQATPLTNRDRGLVRFCLASQNLPLDYERLSGEGVRFLSPPQTDEGGLADVAVCQDPDGTLIELIQIHLGNWPELPRPD
jgi:catechol 2,3-dioxygenase-like lactoylglutathione lyase family enzyme